MNEEFWPNVVVLDTSRIMRRFRQLVKDTGKPRFLPDDMVGEILYCYKHRDRAEARLDDFMMKVAFGSGEEGVYEKVIDGDVANLVFELGEHILIQLNYHYLYDEYGDLPYRHAQAREMNFNDVILRRINSDDYGRPMPITSIPKTGFARYP
jgi:hypothetical protein